MPRPSSSKRRRPTFAECRERTLKEIDNAVTAFNGVDYAEFEASKRLQREAHGWLAAVCQDIWEGSGHADPDLTKYYRTLRNNLAHEYIDVMPAALWNGIRRLPDLRESVEQHKTPPVRERRQDPFIR